MIKIVYIISTLRKTGPTNVLAGIIAHLDRKVYKPYVITLSPEKDLSDSWMPVLSQQGVEIYNLNGSRWKIFSLNHRLQQKLALIHPDIIHSHCFRSTLLNACLPPRCKRVVTIHCDYPTDFTMAYGKITGHIMARMFSWAIEKMDMRICCSQILAELLQKKRPSLVFNYINNGVDTNLFRPTTDLKQARNQLSLPSDKIIFIWAGAFIQRKDPLCWVKAIKKMKQENLFFVFCGEGPLLEKCRKELNHCDNVLFTGYTPQLKAYLQAADVYVSSSRSEGLPCAVLEAAACGLTLLLTNIPQHQYIFQKGMGLLVPSGTPNAFYYAVQRLEKTTELNTKEKRYLYIENNFSNYAMSRSYQKIYTKSLRMN